MKNQPTIKLSPLQRQASKVMSEIFGRNPRVSINSAPGSGKSTLIVGFTQEFYNKAVLKKDIYDPQPDGSLDFYPQGEIKNLSEFAFIDNVGESIEFPNGDSKMMVLTFNTAATKEMYEKCASTYVDTLEKSNVDMGIVDNSSKLVLKKDFLAKNLDMSTYHSLFLKAATPLINMHGYQPDYAKGNFYKKDIELSLLASKTEFNDTKLNYLHKAVNKYHLSTSSVEQFINDEIKSMEEQNSLSVAPEATYLKDLKNTISYLYALMKKDAPDNEKKYVSMPHCFYYKLAYDMAMENETFLKSMFSDGSGKEYKAIIVDEAQDSDKMVYNLIRKTKLPTIYVGDDNQNIYGFRGTFNVFSELKTDPTSAEFKLLESFRFGKAIASVSSNFPVDLTRDNSKRIEIKGIKDADAVVEKPLNLDNLKNFLANMCGHYDSLGGKKKDKASSIAIITRSNAEAFRLYSELKVVPCLTNNIKLQSGIKDEIKEFIKKGISAIKDAGVKDQIKLALNTYSDVGAEEILSNQKACDILKDSEYSSFLRIKKSDSLGIDDEIVEALTARQNGNAPIEIVTTHGSKGLEYNNVIIASDFIKEKEDDIQMYFNEEISEQHTNDLSFITDDEMNENAPIEDLIVEPSSNENVSQLSQEEINIMHVALTRAKEGLLFMDSPLYQKIRNSIKEASKLSDPELLDFLRENLNKKNIALNQIDQLNDLDKELKNISSSFLDTTSLVEESDIMGNNKEDYNVGLFQ